MARQPTENAEKLMRFLAGSLVSWLTFQQSARRAKMYTEYFMYPPIFEVASGRGWKIRPQFPIFYENTWKYVDFVFYNATHKNEVAAIEVSFIKEKSKKDKINNDKYKLQQFKSDDFFGGKFGEMKRFIMIAGKENELKKYCNSNLPEAAQLLRKKQHVKGIGWIYVSPLKLHTKNGSGQLACWCVMVLSVQMRKSSSGRLQESRFIARLK
jgi:hypothetical protein